MERRRQLGLLAIVLLASGIASAQTRASLAGDAAAGTEQAAIDPLALEQVEARLAAARVEVAAEGGPALSARGGELMERRVSLLERQLEILTAAPAEVVPATSGEATEPSMYALNMLYEARREAARDQKRRKELLAVRRGSLDDAKKALDDAERVRRAGRTLASADQDDAGAPPTAPGVLALEAAVARERVHLKTLEVRQAERATSQAGAIDALDAQIAAMRSALASAAARGRDGAEALAARELEARRTIERASRSLATVELRMRAARDRYARSADDRARLDEAESLAAQADALRQRIALSEASIERVAARRTMYAHWDGLVAGPATEELRAEAGDFARSLEATAAEQALALEAAAADVRRRLDALDERLATASGSAAADEWAEQREALVSLRDAQLADLEDVRLGERTAGRVLADLETGLGALDLRGRLAAVVESGRELWSYEITAVDDEPITVGSIVLALALFVAGAWLSRRIAHWLSGLATRRLRLDAGGAQAVETLTFYVLVVSFTLFALRAVHFPLGAFTVLGGALAIGIGFGSQNVMNNFISGLILMLERPVRASDVVEVDGNYGTIERIGARSTQIRSTDGRHIIVPNSFFLESNVVNWTLSDEMIRASVVVGVVYGSPTRLVEELIQRVVDEDDQRDRQPRAGGHLRRLRRQLAELRGALLGAGAFADGDAQGREPHPLPHRRPVPRARPGDRVPAARRPSRQRLADRGEARRGRGARGLRRAASGGQAVSTPAASPSPSSAIAISRISTLRTLPVTVIGKSSTNFT